MAVIRTFHLALVLTLTVIAIAQLESGAGDLIKGDFYATTIQGGGGYMAPFGYRPGSATRTSSCHHVREVPPNIRSADVLKPWGLSSFYKKYTESYGIPVLASYDVPDDALKRACYTLRFLLAGNSAVRESFYRYSGRVAVIGRNEVTTRIPEHSSLPFWLNMNERGLGATPHAPVSSAGEENILCYWLDRNSDQDILLLELAHAVHLLGAAHGIPGWDMRLRSLFIESESRGMWATTYSMTSPEEYFAVGVQSYFNSRSFFAVLDSTKVRINTRAKLRVCDPKLYSLIQEVFPCDNIYLQRCNSSRAEEDAQRLHMDCHTAAESSDGDDEDAQRLHMDCDTAAESSDGDIYLPMRIMRVIANDVSMLFEIAGVMIYLLLRLVQEVFTVFRFSDCSDKNWNCVYWASTNCCTVYAAYMHKNCQRSCNLCTTECMDTNVKCVYHARLNACTTHAEYMKMYCRRSCKLCYSECNDNNKECVYWASNNACMTDAEYMLKNCPKSCNFCNTECIDDHEDCGTRASDNACTTQAQYMQIFCRKSCNLCNTGDLVCIDSNPYCPAWALSGACQTHSGYMSNNCRKSCELC